MENNQPAEAEKVKKPRARKTKKTAAETVAPEAQPVVVAPAPAPVMPAPVAPAPAPAVEAPKKCKCCKHHRVLTAFCILTALGLSGTSLTFSILSYNKSNTPLTFAGGGPDGNSANFTEGSIADVFSKVSPSVVSIVTETKSTSFFGRETSSQAAGTGIIVSADGYILTNKHVVEGATAINIVTAEGKTYKKAQVVAYDPLNDIAFLKLDGVSDLPAATLGNSKTLTVGQQVIVIGNALGEYRNTVTSGIISGTGRTITATDSSGSMQETLNDLIQTDAAINPGNSGGPLVNAAGEVIGINTATSTSADNIGFAIPISSIKGMLSQLIEKGEAKRAYIGVYSVGINPSIADTYNLPVSYGAYLYNSQSYSAIIKDSPAAKADLKDKDIITAVGGVKIGTAGSLFSLLGEYKPGDTVQLTVLRGGSEIAVNVELGAYEEK